MTATATYSCTVCNMRFEDPRERDLHQELDHNYRAPTLAELGAERAAIMETQGFHAGDRVTVLIDCAQNIPAHVRFAEGDVGEVVINHTHGPEVISVRFPDSGTRMLHAIAPENLRNETR